MVVGARVLQGSAADGFGGLAAPKPLAWRQAYCRSELKIRCRCRYG